MKVDLRQTRFIFIGLVITSLLFFGSILDMIANTAIITPKITYWLTFLSLIGGAIAYFYFKKNPIINKEGEEIEGLNLIIFAGTFALIIVLWIPRFGDTESSSNSLTQSRNSKTNLPEITKINDIDSEIKRKSILIKDYRPKSKGKNKIYLLRFFFSRENSELLVVLNKIEIYVNGLTNPFQTIELPEKDFIFGMTMIDFKEKEDGSVIIQDLNFDGFDDFRFRTDLGSGGESYECYLYHDGDGSFIKSESFSLLFNHNAVKLNKKKKEIEISRVCDIKPFYQTFTYKLVGYDELELLEETVCEEKNYYVENN